MALPAGLDEVTYEYEWYRDVLAAFDEAGYAFRPFDGPADEAVVYLRHDIDWSPAKALRMAEIEAEMGVTSMYFFLVTSPFYNALSASSRRAIREVSSLGHEVGLHFAVREYFDGDPGSEQLHERVRADRRVLETVLDDVTDIVAFHNPPEWTLGRRFEGITSTYEPRFFEEITYMSDSLQRWREDPPFEGRDALPNAVQILTHPALWGDESRDAEAHIQAVQENLLRRIDEQMEAFSRLDW